VLLQLLAERAHAGDTRQDREPIQALEFVLGAQCATQPVEQRSQAEAHDAGEQHCEDEVANRLR